MSSNTTYYKFSFISSNWLYDYLLNFQGKNKSLADVKEDSINKLEEIFRQKGYGEHTRENWVKCAKQVKCLSECRDSNGFKNRYDIQYNRKKCVPYTRKMNPKYKPDSKSWDPNNIYQYAYDFLTSYDSIVYTLENWKKLQRNSSKSSIENKISNNDILIEYIVNSYSSNIIEKIINGYKRYRYEISKKLEEKIQSLGLSNRRPSNNYYNNYHPYPGYDPNTYVRARKGAFDIRAKELLEEQKTQSAQPIPSTLSTQSTQSTLVGGKNKSRKSRKNKKQRKTKKHNKSKKQRKTRKYRKSKK